MKFNKLLIPALSLLLVVPGCVSSPAIRAGMNACSTLVPDEWAKGVEHTPIPDEAPAQPKGDPSSASYWRLMFDWAMSEEKKWAAFAVNESAKVDQANGRTADTINITRRCEERDAKAVKRASRGFLGL